ncbi:MAG: transposase [Candidatus Hydrogenedentes bacterium]|nr:transposase [Candidatus Hydrogenedentota bacterium]
MTNPPHRKTRETFNTPGEAHELTFTCFKYQKFLTKDRTRQYVIDSLNRSRKKYAFDIWAYVIMPEHIHLLIFPTEEEYDVSKILKSVKSSVAKKAMNYLRSHNPEGLKYLATGYATQPYTFWMEGGGYDRNAIKKETVDLYPQQSRSPGLGGTSRGLALVEHAGTPESRDWPATVGLGLLPILTNSQVENLHSWQPRIHQDNRLGATLTRRSEAGEFAGAGHQDYLNARK